MIKRAAFTLIELIFSMVIIAIAFTVIPKIMQLATKASSQNLREEAMYNAVAYIGLIKSTAWDENNTEVDDILISNDGNSEYDCNLSSGYRRGGFDGSRNCKDDKNSSIDLGEDSNDDGYDDDMDDFDAVIATNDTNSREYNLTIGVKYIQDINETEAQFVNSEEDNSTNTKLVTITVKVKKKDSALGTSLVQMPFVTENIGQLQINKRSWN